MRRVSVLLLEPSSGVAHEPSVDHRSAGGVGGDLLPLRLGPPWKSDVFADKQLQPGFPF